MGSRLVSSMILVGIAFFFVGMRAALAIPPWAKNDGQRLEGATYRVACQGGGPSIDVARRIATEGCISSARRQLVTTFRVESLTVQTETNAALHEAVSENVRVTGLKCHPEKEEVSATKEADTFEIWLLCRFDLGAAKVEPSSGKHNRSDDPSDSTIAAGDSVRNRTELSQVQGTGKSVNNGRRFSSSSWQLTVAVIPKCSSIIVHGSKSRVLPCSGNPIVLTLEAGDREAIVRAEGFQPKTIQLNPEGKSHGPINVVLEPM